MGCLLVLFEFVSILVIGILQGKTFSGMVLKPHVIWIVWGLVTVIRLWTAWSQWRMEQQDSKAERYANCYLIGVRISGILMFLLFLYAAMRDFSTFAAMPKTIVTIGKVVGEDGLLVMFPFIQGPYVENLVNDLFIREVWAQTLFCLIGSMAFYLWCGWLFGVLPWQW